MRYALGSSGIAGAASVLTAERSLLPSIFNRPQIRHATRLGSLGVFPLAKRAASVLEGGRITRASFVGHDGCSFPFSLNFSLNRCLILSSGRHRGA